MHIGFKPGCGSKKAFFFFETFTGEIFSQKEEFVLWKVIGYEDELGKHEMRR